MKFQTWILSLKWPLFIINLRVFIPFGDNGRTRRIVNVLYPVQGLLDIPILYLSRYIIKFKTVIKQIICRMSEIMVIGLHG